MKTIKRINPKTNDVEYKRLADYEASNLVKGGWQYCPKTEWKKNVRDFGKDEIENSSVQGEIYNKDKKNSKKHAKKTAEV